jgi:ribosomal protein S18 acetylase RimI-like enzyme
MSLTYYKRYRMELNLRRTVLREARLSKDYVWAAWDAGLSWAHATAKYESFVGDVDSEVFPSLGDRTACAKLMDAISGHSGFVPQSTWLVQFIGSEFRGPTPCGTIQGLRISPTYGQIQNVGVSPLHRGVGLGRALVLRCLAGFQSVGVTRVQLEVTAANRHAVELYRSLGFSLAHTSYREVDVERTRLAPAASV